MESIPSTSRLITTFSGILLIAFMLLQFVDFLSFPFLCLAFCLGLSIIALIILILKQTREMILQRSYKLIWQVLLGSFALIVVVFQPWKYVIEAMKSPVLYHGTNRGMITENSIKLRADSSFEFLVGRFDKDQTYIGRYSISGDTVILSYQENVPENWSNQFIIDKKGLQEIKVNERYCGEEYFYFQ